MRYISLLTCILFLSSCVYTTTYYKVPDYAETTIRTRTPTYKLKAAVVADPAVAGTITIDSGVYDAVLEFDYYHYVLKKFAYLFSEISLEEANKTNADVLLQSRYSLEAKDDNLLLKLSLDISDGYSKKLLFSETVQQEMDYDRSSGARFFFTALLLPPVFGAPIYAAAAKGKAKNNAEITGKSIEAAVAKMAKSVENSGKLSSYEDSRYSGKPAAAVPPLPSLSDRPETAAAKETPLTDIDSLPLVKARRSSNKFAIVIGIQDYRQHLQPARYANRDASGMKLYLTKVLGFPEENIVLLSGANATKSDFEKYIETWLKNNVKPDSTVVFYFSGHGAPDPATGDGYLVPYDGDPTYIQQTGYSLKRLYGALAALNAANVMVFLDSCFSGAGGKSVLARDARPLVMVTAPPVLPSKRMLVMTASAGNQVSNTFDEKGHGLFTYYLLKGIKGMIEDERYSRIEIGDLYRFVKPLVEQTSRTRNNSEQTPQLITGDDSMKTQDLL